MAVIDPACPVIRWSLHAMTREAAEDGGRPQGIPDRSGSLTPMSDDIPAPVEIPHLRTIVMPRDANPSGAIFDG